MSGLGALLLRDPSMTRAESICNFDPHSTLALSALVEVKLEESVGSMFPLFFWTNMLFRLQSSICSAHYFIKTKKMDE